MIDLPAHRVHHAAALLFLLAVLPTFMSSMRTYRSFLVLRSAYKADAPITSSIRGWMTLDYIATTYHTPRAALIERLGAESVADGETSLRLLAFRADVLPREYIARVQRAIAQVAKPADLAPATNASGCLASLRDKILTALLVYGYPVLGAIAAARRFLASLSLLLLLLTMLTGAGLVATGRVPALPQPVAD